MNGVQDVLDAVDAPGVMATVVTRDGQVWHGAAGEVAPLTPFRCASVTKTFVAAASLVLAESGRLGLDDPLSRWLPEFADQLLGGGFDPGAITVQHLVWHLSGLPDFASDPAYYEAVLQDPKHVWSRAEQVAWSMERQAPVGRPGRVFCYSDTGYVLLGAVLERVTGSDLDVALRGVLRWQELGVQHTFLETFAPEVARARQWVGSVDTSHFHPSMDLWGGGGLVTTTADLAVFFRALLDGRVVRDLDRMLTPILPNDLGMGAGIFPMPFGEAWWGHTGFWNTCAAAQRGTRAAVSVAVLQREAEPAPEVARRLVSAEGSAGRPVWP